MGLYYFKEENYPFFTFFNFVPDDAYFFLPKHVVAFTVATKKVVHSEVIFVS